MEHNHHDCIACGCYHPAIDLLLKLGATATTETPGADVPPINLPEEKANEPYWFYGGKIYPVEYTNGKPGEPCDAMGIAAGRVVCVGTKPEVELAMRHYPTPTTNKIDLKGKTILPGLIEPHCHIMPSAVLLYSGFWEDYSPFNTQFLKQTYSRDVLKNEISDTLKIMATVPDKQMYWLLGNGLDNALLEGCDCDGRNILNCIDIDFFEALETQLEPGQIRPILILSASEHTAYANKSALKLTWASGKVTGYKTEQDYIDGTKGVLQEMEMIAPAMLAINQEQGEAMTCEKNMRKAIGLFFEDARSKGTTLMFDASMPTGSATTYFKGKDWNMHIGMAYSFNTGNSRKDAKMDLDVFLDEHTFSSPGESDLTAYWGSIKIVSDGSNQGVTGYQKKPYACAPYSGKEIPGAHGIYNFQTQSLISAQPEDKLSPEEYNNFIVSHIVKKGWPLMIHANGTKATEVTIEAFRIASAQPGVAFKEKRHRMEHASLLSDTNISDMKKIGIQPSFLIGHVGYWGNVLNRVIFPGEAEKLLDRCHSVTGTAENDLRFTLHSDCTVSPVGVLRYMEQAITRITEDSPEAKDFLKLWTKDKKAKAPDLAKSVLNKNERVDVHRALRAATIDAAWQCHADKEVGSLLKDKLADFVILSENPMEMSAEKAFLNMRNIKVEQTWSKGIKVYDYSETKQAQPLLQE
jgi:predicted amidohydrolase YtcJ